VDFDHVVRRRRMVRSFSGQPVPPEQLERVLALAWRAPSAGNTGGWDAVVMSGDETEAFWQATTTPEWRARSRRWAGLARAPVVVAVFVDPDAYVERYRADDKQPGALGTGLQAWTVPYWYVDGGFALLLMLLAATDAGLGACLLGNFRGEDALAKALGVPPERRYVGAVAMGVPGGDDPPSSSLARGRRSVHQVVHRGRW
jgi:nitroreductase